MRQISLLRLSTLIISSCFLMLVLGSSVVVGEELSVPVVTSTGKIVIINPDGPFVMIRKADGKKVSLELTPETKVTLDGESLPLDQISALEIGFVATAEHFTNDTGMQQTISLAVVREVAP